MRCLNKLQREAERAKIKLSCKENCLIDLNNILPRDDDDFDEIILSREEFEARIREEGLLDRIERCIVDSLRIKAIKKELINAVIIQGGSSNIPCIQNLIKRFFGEEKIINVDPIFGVAKGICRYAQIRKEFEEQIVPVIDSLPESIGIETSGLQMNFIGKKGDQLPIQTEHVFCKMTNNQTEIKIPIFGGESKYTSDNEFIGEIKIKNIPAVPAGKVFIIISTTIDKSGILLLSAKLKDENGEIIELEVENNRINLMTIHQDAEIILIREILAPYFPH